MDSVAKGRGHTTKDDFTVKIFSFSMRILPPDPTFAVPNGG
jgi:hypothetical protein